MNKRYYIAVPNKVKWGYQTVPTWKNYSFTGNLEDAQKKAIELFTNEGYLEENIIDNLVSYYDSESYDKIYENWDSFSEEQKYESSKDFYKDFLEFSIDDFNRGLTLWDEVSNDYKKNIFNDELKVIELN